MSVERRRLAVVLAAGLVLAGCNMADREAEAASDPAVRKGGDTRYGEYALAAEDWWKPAPDHLKDTLYTWGQASGLVADRPDRILVGFTGDRPKASLGAGGAGGGGGRALARNLVVAVNADGVMTENWTQWDSVIGFPHQLYISPYDPERHIWIVDRGGGPHDVHEQILKFTNDGKQLVLRMTDPQPVQSDAEVAANQPPGPLDFGQAAVLAFFPNGDFLVGDGYQNGRIVRYNPQGELISEFGVPGKNGPGQFDLVHGVAIDRQHRIYVSDRANERIQVFTEAGEFIEEWPDIKGPTGIYIDERDNVWVLSTTLNQILEYNLNGELLYNFGAYCCTRGGFPGGFSRPHQMNVDSEGNLYVANYDGGYVTKYTPKAGADPNRLVGQVLKLDK
jgi:hypothetical protein